MIRFAVVCLLYWHITETITTEVVVGLGTSYWGTLFENFPPFGATVYDDANTGQDYVEDFDKMTLYTTTHKNKTYWQHIGNLQDHMRSSVSIMRPPQPEGAPFDGYVQFVPHDSKLPGHLHSTEDFVMHPGTTIQVVYWQYSFFSFLAFLIRRGLLMLAQ